MTASPPGYKAALRLPGLDGLRGIACLMVFLYHLRWHVRGGSDIPAALPILGFDVEPLFARLDAGVAIFFVLSGLLLSLPFWKNILNGEAAPDLRRYLWRRAYRILPAYYSVLIVVYLLRGGTYTLSGGIDFLLHATLLHTFSESGYYGVYPLLWTIGIELQFYLLLPPIMAAIGILWRRHGATVTFGTLFAGSWALDFTARAALASLAPLVPDRFLADQGSVVVSGTIFSYLKLFAFGIAAAYVVLRWRMRPWSADGFVLLGCVGFIALLLGSAEATWRQTSLTGWPLNACAITLITLGLANGGRISRVLSTPPLVALGAISYGVYLWHELVQRAVFGGTLPNHLRGWALFIAGGIVAFAVTAAIAALSWRFLERPALRIPHPLAR